uniref:Umc2169 n=1 Tax=Arundo donax TaxID=35708 RepID=A0A0A9F0C9_ARUDO
MTHKQSLTSWRTRLTRMLG